MVPACCPVCRTRFAIEPPAVGKLAVCPDCGNRFPLPSAGVGGTFAAAPRPTLAGPRFALAPPRTPAALAPSLPLGLVFGILGGAAVLFVSCVAVVLFCLSAARSVATLPPEAPADRSILPPPAPPPAPAAQGPESIGAPTRQALPPEPAKAAPVPIDNEPRPVAVVPDPEIPEPVQPAPVVKPDPPADPLGTLIEDVKNDDFFRRNGALEKLRTFPVDEKRKALVARAVEPLLADANPFLRRNSAQVLGVWGTADSVPILLKHIGDAEQDIFLRQTVVEVLGRFQDERTAEPIAGLLRNFFLKGHAVKSLQAMGPTAEKAVLPLLESEDVNLRIAACEILAKVGGKSSVPELEAARKDTNRTYAKAATEALRAVRERIQ